MESTTFRTSRLLILMLVTGLGAILVAWQKQKAPQKHSSPKITATDTLPDKKSSRDRKVRNLDEALEDLDHVKIDIDLDQLNVELSKIGPEVQKEIAKAGVEVARALKEIDIPKIKVEVDAAMASIDWPKIKVELDKVKEINFDKINIDLEKVDQELKKIKPTLELNLKNVKVEIEKAKAELKEYKYFVDGLEQDGLINKKGEYSIQHKNGELIINGKTQPRDVYNKYRSFLEKHKTLKLERSNDDFTIDTD